MPSRDIYNKPAYWRMRAEELRAQAEQMRLEAPRAQMFAIVDQFEALARLLEQELRTLLDPSFAADGGVGRRDDNVTPLRGGG